VLEIDEKFEFGPSAFSVFQILDQIGVCEGTYGHSILSSRQDGRMLKSALKSLSTPLCNAHTPTVSSANLWAQEAEREGTFSQQRGTFWRHFGIFWEPHAQARGGKWWEMKRR
jgi:hypothetical protein